MIRFIAAFIAVLAALVMAFGIDWSREDCIERAARTAPTDSGFRALVYMCHEKFPDKPELKPFNGELDKK